MAKKKKVLVTGGTGFVGPYLLSRLKNSEVTCITQEKIDTQLNKRFPFVSFIKGDLLEIKSLRRAIGNSSYDQVFHLAAQSIPAKAKTDPSSTFLTNVSGTLNLLNVLVETKSHAKVLFTSTSHVYGNTFKIKSKVSESDPVSPNCNYALSKVMAEQVCKEFVDKNLIDVRIARSFNHFGYGQAKELAFSNWLSQIINLEKDSTSNRKKVYVGNLDVSRDFLPVQDVISAYLCIMEKGKSGEVYNVSSSRPRKLSTYLKHLLKISTLDIKNVDMYPEKKRLRKSDFSTISGANLKLRKLGWTPKQDSLNALTQMYEKYRVHEIKRVDD